METIDLSDYNNNDLFWKGFVNLENNPYKLNTSLKGFRCLFLFLTKETDLSKHESPTPLGNMASLLRMNDSKVTISIQNIDSYDKNNFKNYDLICFFPMVSLFKQTLDFSDKLKKDFPQSKICFFNSDQHQHEMILCNPKAKEFAKALMEKYPSIDFVLVGEAETSLVKLVEKIFKKEKDFSDIPSCLYRKNNQVMISKKSIEPINYEFMPFQSRDFLEKSISKEGINTQSPRLQSSRGCISQCLYCTESSANITEGGRKTPILKRDILKFLEEVEILYKYYKVVFFNIMDSCFEDSGKQGIDRMKFFFEEINKRNIKASFKIHLRVDTLNKLDNNFLMFLKKSGVDILALGIESGLEKELRSYRKITTVEENLKNITRINNLDGKFFCVLGHIMFSPILKLEDLPKKIEFIRNIHFGWDYTEMVNNILVYPETGYHNFIKEKGLELEHDELATLIPYSFEDENVKKIADETAKIKVKCPEIARLNKSLYDSLNIISRYYNKINKDMWKDEEFFLKFKDSINKILLEVENIYCRYFLELIGLVKEDWSDEKKDEIYNKWVPERIPKIFLKVESLLSEFFDFYKKQGISTKKIFLKTWMPIRMSPNTKVGITGGESEK
ncbi:MAG: hypothetical protein KKG75_04355 [Nanoarchaeota archaeon]|nr:hypothetical protein [Nanoarchaeota archaeon]